jgi:hypothetical protein
MSPRPKYGGRAAGEPAMSAGEEFQRELRTALVNLHKAQRNRRGRLPKGLERADLGRQGYRREPAKREEDDRGE